MNPFKKRQRAHLSAIVSVDCYGFELFSPL